MKFNSRCEQAWWEKLRDPPMLLSNEIVLLRYGKQFANMSYEAETVRHVAAHLGSLKVLKKLWEWIKEKLTSEEIKNKLLATENEGRTAWHLTAQKGKLEILQKVWEWAEEKLTTAENNNKLLAAENEGRTAWHLVAQKGNLETLQKVWKWT